MVISMSFAVIPDGSSTVMVIEWRSMSLFLTGETYVLTEGNSPGETARAMGGEDAPRVVDSGVTESKVKKFL